MCLWKMVVFIMLSVGVSCSSYAVDKGVPEYDAERVIFTSDKETVSIKAKNLSVKGFDLLSALMVKFESEKKRKIPFYITPLLISVKDNEGVQFRVNKLAEANELPTDREYGFYINLTPLPSNTGRSGRGASFIHQIALFYRPISLNNKNEANNVYRKIKIKKVEKGIMIRNPTPYYASIGRMMVNNKNFSGKKLNIVPPLSEIEIPINEQVYSFDFQLINDHGGLTRSISVIF